MSNIKQHPKFVMQVGREQPVPRLVSINDFSEKSNNLSAGKKDILKKSNLREKSADHNYTNGNSNPKKTGNNFYYDSREDPSLLYEQQQRDEYLRQSRQQQSPIDNRSQSFYNPHGSLTTHTANGFTIINRQNLNQSAFQNQQTAPSSTNYYTTLRKQLPITEPRNYRLDVIQLEKLLEIEKQEKLELQQIIKEITVQSEKLKEVNEHIVARLKELEKNFVEEKIYEEKDKDERVRKAIRQVYQDVETYVRAQIQTLTYKLKGEKMTPLLEKKLELFMESMLQINQRTVEMFKISIAKKQSNAFTGNVSNPLASFLSNNEPSNEKENLSASNIHFMTRLSILSDTKNRHSPSNKNKLQASSSPHSGRKLINKAYITSSSHTRRRPSPSRVLFQTSGSNQPNANMPHEYSTILKQLENSQEEMIRQEIDDDEERELLQEEESPYMHVRLRDHLFGGEVEGSGVGRKRSKSKMMVGQSFVERNKYYQTANYEENNFRVKQYTPNKRKKIFDKNYQDRSRSKSKSRRYNTQYH